MQLKMLNVFSQIIDSEYAVRLGMSELFRCVSGGDPGGNIESGCSFLHTSPGYQNHSNH